MKKILLTLFVYSFLHQALLSQEMGLVFGSVSESDLQMTSYIGDIEAEAIILYDKGEVSFKIDNAQNRINLLYKRIRRIKILKTSALGFADVSIGFFKSGYNRNQSVYDIQAFSYGLNNGAFQQRSLDQGLIFEKNLDEEYFVKTFSIPNVKVGSVIEYQYTMEIPNANSVPDWEFQSEIPTRTSEFEISLTPFYAYNYLLQGGNKFSSTNKKEQTEKRRFAGIEFTDVTYNFIMKDQPAFKDEVFITSKNDYITKLDWQLTGIYYPTGGSKEFMSTWPEVSNELLKFDTFGKFVQSAYKSNRKKINYELGLEGLSSLEKAIKITAHVKANYKWNGYYQKHTDLTYKEFRKVKVGSSAEINLYLTGLLKAAGLDANPLLISTRGHGRIKEEYPMSSFFNASVVAVNIDGRYYLVEGTEQQLPFGWLPAECINEKGLLVKKDSDLWLDVSAEPTSSIKEVMNLRIDVENAIVSGQFKKSLTGYDALYHKKNPEQITLELNDYEVDGEILKSNENKNNVPFIISYSAEVSGIDRYGNMINIRPFLNKPWGENPLKAKNRSYPVDLTYKREREYISIITIPDGYSVATMPEATMIDNSLVKIVYTAEVKEAVINVTASYLFKKSIYQPNDYTQIREHINQFIEKFNEQIVLEKKD